VKKILFVLLVSISLFSCKEKNIKTETDSLTNIIKLELLGIDLNFDSASFVLAPSKSCYDSAQIKGLKYSLFVFYPRKYISSKEKFSLLEEIGDTVLIPDDLIIPLRKNQEVKQGDVLLTWWQSGTGMQRAIVLSAKNPLRPVVYYLDNQFYFYYDENDPTFWIDTLKENSYNILDEKWCSGRSIIVEQNGVSSFYIVINSNTDKILALSWSGTVGIFDKKICKLIPLFQNFNKGDSVLAPYLGTYSKGVVKSTFKDIGKMKVEIQFYDTTMTSKVSIIDVLKL